MAQVKISTAVEWFSTANKCTVTFELFSANLTSVDEMRRVTLQPCTVFIVRQN
jgi:hypothetical protein